MIDFCSFHNTYISDSKCIRPLATVSFPLILIFNIPLFLNIIQLILLTICLFSKIDFKNFTIIYSRIEPLLPLRDQSCKKIVCNQLKPVIAQNVRIDVNF